VGNFTLPLHFMLAQHIVLTLHLTDPFLSSKVVRFLLLLLLRLLNVLSLAFG
jgi:hypothetical protein